MKKEEKKKFKKTTLGINRTFSNAAALDFAFSIEP